MPNEDYDFLRPTHLMSANEIIRIAEIFVGLGINKIRLTGGEPLIRKDLPEILKGLHSLPVKLTLTTNGLLLDRYFEILNQYGINSVNISLDTLQSDKFHRITKRNEFERVWKNINTMLSQNFDVKINVVAVKHQIEDEIIEFIELTQDRKLEVRFIEFMPFDGNYWDANKVLTSQELLSIIQQKYQIYKIADSPNDTAKHYQLPNAQGKFAFITTMSDHFCSTCNRLRLTADGKIKNCLFDKNELDLLTPFRQGENINAMIQESVSRKKIALGGQFTNQFKTTNPMHIINRSMIKIGG